MKKTILLFAFSLLLLQVQAQDGTIDPTFGNGGFYTFPPPFPLTQVTNEGKVVSVTKSANGFKIYRYNSDGSPDASFGVNGVVESKFNVKDEVVQVLVQSDGKIIVCGTTFDGTGPVPPPRYYFAIARYNYDGTPDLSFGMVRVNANNGHADGSFKGVGLSNTDKLVFEAEFPSPGGLSTILYFPGPNPHALVGPPALSSISFVYGGPFAVSNAGQVVAEGYEPTTTPGHEHFLNLFHANGDRDLSFGTNGIIDLGHAFTSFAFQNETKIIAYDGNQLVRFKTDGSIDASFGTNGTVAPPFSIDVLLIQDNEKIIIGGGLNGNFALARYHPDGSLDNSFGTNGITISDFGTNEKISQVKIGTNRLYAYGSDILAAYRLTLPCTAPTFLNNNQIVLDASCNGSDGNISIIPTSGTAPYQYSINGGATYVVGPNGGYTFQGLAPGSYQLRLKDANGCESAVVTREVKNVYGTPSFLNNGTIVLDASCKGGDGSISIIPTCGQAPFQYSIDGGATYVQGPDGGYTFQNLSSGTYQLRLKDANGNQSAVVTRQVKPNAFGNCATLSAINPKLHSSALDAMSVSAYPNPSHGQFKVQLTGLYSSKVQVQVLDASGSVLQTRTVNASETSVVDINLQGKAKGLYLIRVISDKGVQMQKVQVH